MNSKFLLLPTALMVAGHSAAEAKGKKSDQRPNILVILADDLGYSDLGCYGSEIHTPNLDKLAKQGVRFNHFYNTSRSCPTRASLLTGLYQHQAGIGRMTFDDHLPGYRGTLSRNAVTIAEVLKESGYATSMVGKWHIAETPLRKDQREWLAHHVYHETYSDLCHYPVNRGFDTHYGTIYGVVDYFDPFSLVEGEVPVKEVPDGYYITQALSDRAKTINHSLCTWLTQHHTGHCMHCRKILKNIRIPIKLAGKLSVTPVTNVRNSLVYSLTWIISCLIDSSKINGKITHMLNGMLVLWLFMLP